MKFKNKDIVQLKASEQTEEYGDKVYTYSHVLIDFPIQPGDETESWYAVDAIPCDKKGNIIGPETKGSPIYTSTFKKVVGNKS